MLYTYNFCVFLEKPIKFQGESWNLQLQRTFELHQVMASVNEKFNLPHGSHIKKHDMRLLIGRITFLICEKSDTPHLIGSHRFVNKNLLSDFPVSKSQYV